MEILYLIILGFVQGMTEFLPVSSSGHLVLLSRWFGIEDSLFVSIVLHFATLLSICVVLRKEVSSIIKNPFSKQAKNLIFATIPTCLIAIVLMPLINQSFEGKALPFCFLITAIFLLCSQVFLKKESHHIKRKDAVLMGIAQGLAAFPGISRAGATISAGLCSGADKNDVSKFSFLMSIPIIILSMLLEIYKIINLNIDIKVNVIGIIFAFIVAFLIGVFSIKTMIKLMQKANLKWFSLYLIFIALISIF